MNDLYDVFEREGIPYYLSSFSALDMLFRIDDHPNAYIYSESTLARIAQVFPNLEFPGLESADAVVNTGDGTIRLITGDTASDPPRGTFTVQGLLYDRKRRVFRDPHECYFDIRKPVLIPSIPFRRDWQSVHDAAVLTSRYHYELPDFALGPDLQGITAPMEDQRSLLMSIMASKQPWKGLRLLMREGYIRTHWPELFQMEGTDHSKEGHPEGNVWEHTLETFKYRKTLDPVLSLGLFLHDVGKPISPRNVGKAFDGHAEIGAATAERFLRRLGMPEETVRQVVYLVLHHMIPGALNVLPVNRVERTMSNPLFPVLLELYRCDLSSTYRGPDGYYEACKVYRSFLKNTRNPFRSSDGKKLDGKKLIRLYVE